MASVNAIYELEVVTDNPMFEGFAFAEDEPSLFGDDDLSCDFDPPEAGEVRDWSMPSLASAWKRPKVEGRVMPFNDYPCVNMLIPAFSSRAVESLRDFLEPNGELLPLESPVGEYFAYNLTTVVDVLDRRRSSVEYWCDPPTTAVEVEYFAFYKTKLRGLSIFRIVDLPNCTLVTDAFVKRVHDHGLNGFHFVKVWPFPANVNWRLEEVKRRRKSGQKVRTKKGPKEVKGNTVVVILILKQNRPSRAEKKQIARFEDELDAQLAVPSLDAPYFGSLEGDDKVAGEYRLFLSCPDANQLVEKLRPWLIGLDWPGDFHVIKRYGTLHDEDAPEELVVLPRTVD